MMGVQRRGLGVLVLVKIVKRWRFQVSVVMVATRSVRIKFINKTVFLVCRYDLLLLLLLLLIMKKMMTLLLLSLLLRRILGMMSVLEMGIVEEML